MTEHESDIASIIADQAQRLFERAATREALDAADGGDFARDIWSSFDEAGLPLALLSEDAGGIGLSPTQAFSLVRQAAYYGLPVPLGETMVVAQLTGQVLSGPASLAEADSDGRAPRVAYGRAAAVVLLERDRGWTLCDVKHGGIAEERNLAGEPRDPLEFDLAGGLHVERPEWLANGGLAHIGAALRALQMSGAMRRVLDLAIEHVASRQQFGRPLAKFQAIQHQLADAAGQVAAASAMAGCAAEAWGRPEFATRAALAKIRAGEAATIVAGIGHQVHGAIGFTQEHILHIFTRRLWAWRDEFGGEPKWQEEVGRSVCAGGGAALWQSVVDMTGGLAA